MRLRTCVALELMAAVSLASAAAASAIFGLGYVQDNWAGEALAAAAHSPGASPAIARERAALRIEPVAAGELDPDALVPPERQPYQTYFVGVRDDELVAPLRDRPIASVRLNRGGSSLSLRIEFAGGARAAFKPNQINPQSIPRKEIAAYRINRLLGLATVPPAIGRKFRTAEILGALDARSAAYLPRIQEEMIPQGEYIVGELSWWVPVLALARVDGYEIDSTDGIVTWKRYLTIGRDIPDESYPVVSQISTMVLFDFIINNPDRWSGSNARATEDGTFLYFMDNTLSFALEDEGHRRVKTYLERAQKFSYRLVVALRDMSDARVREALTYDLGPFDYLLTEAEIASMMKRREWALAFIDGLIAEHGDAEVLVFP